jgi:hypothetical protein
MFIFILIKGYYDNVYQMATIITLDLICICVYAFVSGTNFHWRYLFTCLGFFLLGFVFWKMEEWKIFCFPDSIVQFHAIWHILTSIALVYLYLFFRTEVKVEH